MKAKEQAEMERSLLERLVKIGNRFRNTPIVDDDFVGIKNEFDSVLRNASRFIEDNRKLVVNETTMIVDGCMGLSEVRVTNINIRQQN